MWEEVKRGRYRERSGKGEKKSTEEDVRGKRSRFGGNWIGKGKEKRKARKRTENGEGLMWRGWKGKGKERKEKRKRTEKEE